MTSLRKHQVPDDGPTIIEQSSGRVVVIDPSPETRAYVQALVSRIVRRMALALLVITFITGLGLYRSERAGDEAQAAAADATAAAAASTKVAELQETESINRQVSACQSTNEFRTRYREDLARRADPVPVDEITATREYRNLPDSVRPFVDFLIATSVQSGISNAELLKTYTENFPIVDCVDLSERLESERATRAITAEDDEQDRQDGEGGG